MGNVRYLLILCILFVAHGLFSQEIIPLTISSKCDTIIKHKKRVKTQIGNLRCIQDPGADQMVYFTKKEEFENYTREEKSTKGKCGDTSEMTFDFNKYDVALIRISIAGCGLPKYSCEVVETKTSYQIYLNFYSQEIVCAEKNIFFRYLLLPKKKSKVPELTICNVSAK
ncbi:MAG: hypothetical protein JWO09_1471 [Bacteroidetes bacterium]|nr:hypothetical protein [Bacteroidota bacterium]